MYHEMIEGAGCQACGVSGIPFSPFVVGSMVVVSGGVVSERDTGAVNLRQRTYETV